MVRHAHGVAQNEGNDEDPDGVIPIEELGPVVLNALVGIGPRSPANRAGNHHHQRNAQSLRCEHELSLFVVIPSVARELHIAPTPRLQIPRRGCSSERQNAQLPYFP